MAQTLYGVEASGLAGLGGGESIRRMLPENHLFIDGSKAVWEATRSAPMVLFYDAYHVLAVRALRATPATRA